MSDLSKALLVVGFIGVVGLMAWALRPVPPTLPTEAAAWPSTAPSPSQVEPSPVATSIEPPPSGPEAAPSATEEEPTTTPPLQTAPPPPTAAEESDTDAQRLAPKWVEHLLPSLWFRTVEGKESTGEMEVVFVLREQRPGTDIYKNTLFVGSRDPGYAQAAATWAKQAAETGAMFFAVPGVNRPAIWPAAGSEQYINGQLRGIELAAKALRASGVDLSGVRVISDVEGWSHGEQARLMSLTTSFATQLGFTIGGKYWAANYGSGPAESRNWYHPPMPDGQTVGISSYMDGERDHEQLCQVSIDLVKSMGLRYAIWYRTDSAWAERQMPAWRRDPACVAVIGWNPKGRVEN